MPDRNTSRLLWLTFTVAFAILAWQFQDDLQSLFSTRGELTIELDADHVVLRWNGQIEAPLASRLEDAYRTYADSTRRFVISLHSPGGSIEQGRDTIKLIRRMQKTHEVDTVVGDKHACASMCVAVYLAGTLRTAAPNARFMFHEVSFRDSESGKVERVPKELVNRTTDDFFERYLKPAGLDPRWLADLREAIRGREVWRTAQQLFDERSGMVQKLE